MKKTFIILALWVCSVSSYAQVPYDTMVVYNYPVKYYDNGNLPVLLLNEDIGLCLRQTHLTIGVNDGDLGTDIILKLKDDKINTTDFFFNKKKVSSIYFMKINTKYNVYDSLQKAYIDTKDSAYIMRGNFYKGVRRTKIKGKYINPHKERLVVKYTKNNTVYYARIPLEAIPVGKVILTKYIGGEDDNPPEYKDKFNLNQPK